MAYKKADYEHALSRGDTDVQMLLFETFGGWSAPVTKLFKKMRDKVQNKLSKKQYEDEVTWSTRTWLALMAQRMSVALQLAAAWEIAVELKVPGVEDARRRSLTPPPSALRHTPYLVRTRLYAVWVPLGKIACELGSYLWHSACGSYDITNK